VLGKFLKSDKKSQFLSPQDANDFKSFAQFLTAIEKDASTWIAELLKASRDSKTIRIGITGPPGAGKSTLISGLIREYRKKKLKVGVIAVDPSSPFSKGAVLGDRIRYSEHFEDKKVFIRSVGSRGAMGGISGSVYLMLRAFDIWNFDVVLIETVGVGQTELEIMNVADKVCVVVVPEFGDSIQALKAGILEIANIFVVNKADRPGADVIAKELEHWATDGNDPIPVLKTIAHEHEGIPALVSALDKLTLKLSGKKKFQAEAAAILRLRFEEKISEALSKVASEEDVLRILKTFKLN
jgi:LAO/AO transport system kinase